MLSACLSRIASVKSKGVTVLFGNDVVVTDRYADGVFTSFISGDNITVHGTCYAVNPEAYAVNGVGGVLVENSTAYGE